MLTYIIFWGIFHVFNREKVGLICSEIGLTVNTDFLRREKMVPRNVDHVQISVKISLVRCVDGPLKEFPGKLQHNKTL